MALDKIFQFSSIDKARLIELDGETMVDLVSDPIFVGKLEAIDRVIIIDKKMAGKPWLITQIVYGSPNHTDLLFSFNGYSNPMSIKGGDVLVIPPLDRLVKNVKNNKTGNETIIELNKRISEPDKNRIKFITKEETIKSPNMNETGSQSSTKGRSIFLGEKEQSSPEAITITKEKLLKTFKSKSKSKS